MTEVWGGNRPSSSGICGRNIQVRQSSPKKGGGESTISGLSLKHKGKERGIMILPEKPSVTSSSEEREGETCGRSPGEKRKIFSYYVKVKEKKTNIHQSGGKGGKNELKAMRGLGPNIKNMCSYQGSDRSVLQRMGDALKGGVLLGMIPDVYRVQITKIRRWGR